MPLNKLINWSLFLLLCVIWGSSFIIMKHSKEQLNGSQIAALRIFSAGVIFLPFGIAHLRKLPRKKLFLVILSGITGNLLPAFFFATAIAKNIDSSLASILNSLTPIFVVLISIAIFHDKIKMQKIFGVLIGFMGLTLLFLLWKGINFDNFKYASLVLLATICYGVNINMVAHFLKDINPVHIATISLAFMTLPTAFVLWQQNFLQLAFDEPQVQWAVVEAVTLGVVGSSIATAIFYVLIKRAGGLFASLVTYGIPFIGIFWGIIDGENITIRQVGCLGIILIGVYLANKPDTRQSKTEMFFPEELAEEAG